MIKIFCEGITDQVFIADCIEHFYNITFQRETKHNNKDKLDILIANQIQIVEIGGCSKLNSELYIAELVDNHEKGGRNIVIFDADYNEKPNGNKGYKSCKQKLEDIIRNKKLKFDYYIWPDNKNDGEIENLLRTLIPLDKECIYNCIDSHQTCLNGLPLNNLKISELKERVGYYLYTCNLKSRPKERDYKNIEYWDLDESKSDSLKLFKTFIDTLGL